MVSTIKSFKSGPMVRENRLPSVSRTLKLILFGLLLAPGLCWSELKFNLPRGVTPISADLYDLHMTIIAICSLIGLIVYGVLAYILINHRLAKGAVPATFSNNLRVENWWTLIPFLILLAMAVPATKVLIEMDDFDDAEVTIKITGMQWKWQYQYLDQGVEFFSKLATPPGQIYGTQTKDPWYLLEVDKPLIVPINKKVRFLVTSNDVIHSWWVPELGVKRDAIPGFIHEAWARIDTPGTYRGQCAELCGVDHGFMPIVVKAVSEMEFNVWIESQGKSLRVTQPAWTLKSVLPKGKQSYDRNCAACHQSDGTGNPPLYPALQSSSVAVGDPIERHIDLVLHGIEGSAMQSFADQLSDQELAAIITYERNAWGNDTGDLITPEQVQQRR